MTARPRSHACRASTVCGSCVLRHVRPAPEDRHGYMMPYPSRHDGVRPARGGRLLTGCRLPRRPRCRRSKPLSPPVSADRISAPKIARFAPTEIAADLSKLSAADRRVLAKLVEASKIIDALFLRQVWAGNEAMLLDLVRDETPDGRARLHYFLINKGPWSRLDHNEPFVAGAPPKPAGANFYPDGATKAEIETLDRSRCPKPSAPARPASSPSSAATPTGGFTLVPYSLEYQNELAHAAALLREAAGLAGRADAEGVSHEARRRVSVERLLRQRRRVDGARRARSSRPSGRTRSTRTSSSTTRRRSSRSSPFATRPRARKLQKFGGELQDIENHLPIDPKYRNPKLGAPGADRRRQRDLRGRRRATAACRPRPSTCRTTSA